MNIDKLCLNCMSPLEHDPTCVYCGFDNRSPQEPPFLPHKTLLVSRYAVGHALRSNGDGITYMGFDQSLKTPIYIREFFPQNIAVRLIDGTSAAAATGMTVQYSAALVDFLNLSRSLARMRDLSHIFPIYDIVEENGTAYAVSEYVPSMTLREYLLANNGIMSWEKVRNIYMPLISTLSTLHAAGIYHFGISPENIYMCEDGKLRLTGFSVKSVRIGHSGNLLPQLYAGYSAIEQYGYDQDDLGPHTDVYSMAAVIYRTIVGNTPPEATARVVNDKLIVPAKIAEMLPTYVLSALANALQIDPADRTSTFEQFREEISGAPSVTQQNVPVKNKAVSTAGVGKKVNNQKEQDKNTERKKGLSNKKLTMITAFCAFIVFFFIGFLVYSNMNGKDDPEQTTASTTETTQSTTSGSTGVDDVALENLVGETYNAERLKKDYPDLEFVKEKEVFSDKYSAGTICEQEPRGNERVPKGTIVKITVSKGQSTVKIPPITGKTYAEAVKILKEAGYENVRRIDSYDGSVEIGKVVRSDPPEGSNYDPEKLVTIHVNIYESENP